VSGLAAGSYTFTATVTDAGGKSATASVTVVVDQPPTVSITGPADGTVLSTGAPVTFTATASDPEDGDLSSAVTWTSSVDGNLGTGASLPVASLSPGTHTIVARVTDAGGLIGSATISLSVTP